MLYSFFLLNNRLQEGVSLLDRPFDERRSILQSNLVEVPNRIRLSELHKPTNEQEVQVFVLFCVIEKCLFDQLKVLMSSIMLQKLEGLVIK